MSLGSCSCQCLEAVLSLDFKGGPHQLILRVKFQAMEWIQKKHMDISCLNPRFHARFHARFPHDPTLNSHEPHMEQAIPISEIPMTSTRLPLIVEPADIGSPGAQPASWKTKDFGDLFWFGDMGTSKEWGTMV